PWHERVHRYLSSGHRANTYRLSPRPRMTRGMTARPTEAARRPTARLPLLRFPRLESELKLDINRLARRGMIDPGGFMVSGFRWTNNCTGEVIGRHERH